jgi:hypothetical protein
MYPSNVFCNTKVRSHSLRECFECCLVSVLEIMEVAGAIGYSRILFFSWFFTACSLTCFGWYVLLFLQEDKDVSNNFFL